MSALLESNCPDLQLLHRGKVRDVYRVDENSLLFVATDRISAFDVVMKNGVPGKGKILTQLSLFWFDLLKNVCGNHLITADIDQMPESVRKYKDQLENRSMLVKNLKILKVEAIIRGYISGSGWNEYLKSGTVCSIPLPPNLKESDRLPQPMFTPSTKADVGEHDENIHPDQAAQIIGKENAEVVADYSIRLYSQARDFASQKGVIIADTKFEFGLDENGKVVLADEVLTPDSSRFWPADSYEPGRGQNSYDKQYLRDYLLSIKFDKKNGIELPQNVIENTQKKYIEVYKILTGKDPVL